MPIMWVFYIITVFSDFCVLQVLCPAVRYSGHNRANFFPLKSIIKPIDPQDLYRTRHVRNIPFIGDNRMAM